MSGGHALDIKLPIGWLITAYGVLLTVYGLVTKKEMYAISLGINVNLAWGVLMTRDRRGVPPDRLPEERPETDLSALD